jgi:periplasmic protein TonB
LDREHNSHEHDRAGLPPRNLGWFAASVAAHALLLAALIYFARVPQPEHQWVLAYVIDPGAGASAARGSSRGAAEASLVPAPLSPPERLPPLAAPPSAPREPALASTPNVPARESLAGLNFDRAAIRDARGGARAGSQSRRSGAAGVGGSDRAGGGSAGGTLAHADYGASPPPAYPVRARRRGEQGTVMLRVLVGADGAVLRAELAQSSGYRRLDAAALEAVRKRWRFIAARRAGEAVESWVLVPIRFTLTEALAAP